MFKQDIEELGLRVGGRPKKKLDPSYLKSMYEDYKIMTGREVAEKYRVSLATVQRYMRIAREEYGHGKAE